MRRQRGLVGLMGLAALVGLGVIARPAVATITTEQSASILVFPKVIANGTLDTIIQITNTSNSMRHAHCFYVNGALTNPDLPPSPTNQPLCTEIDFDIWLTKQQPTHWVVSTGRLDNAGDRNCRPATSGGLPTTCSVTDAAKQSGSSQADCCDAGFDPGRVPPVVPEFTGELKCIEVDVSGAPIPGNALKGEATIEDIATGDVAKYNAIGLKGFDTNNLDLTLCLGGGVSDACPSGAEYEACPHTWILDHPARGAPDRVVEQQPFCGDGVSDLGHACSTVSTNVTVVSCTEPFETQSPPPVTLQFSITNEYEETFSASTTFSCWASFDLGNMDDLNALGVSDIFNTGSLGGEIVQTKVRSASGRGVCLLAPSVPCTSDGDCAAVGGACSLPRGVMPVIMETHTDTTHSLSAMAAQNAHASFQDQQGPDIIQIPLGQGGEIP